MSAAIITSARWLAPALGRLDAVTDAEEAAATLVSARMMLATAGLKFSDLVKTLRTPDYLAEDAPITVENLRAITSRHYAAVPLSDLPHLGYIIQGLRSGRKLAAVEIEAVRRIRRAARGSA